MWKNKLILAAIIIAHKFAFIAIFRNGYNFSRNTIFYFTIIKCKFHVDKIIDTLTKF